MKQSKIKEKEWRLWEQNWNNAYKFFNSKGNTKTKARLKKIWYDNFFIGLKVYLKLLKDINI